MAHIEESGTGGRKTNVDLNIVPFIDLMSVCIIFLLITAVWTHVSMIQIGSSVYGKKTSENSVAPKPDQDIVLRLDIQEVGYRLVRGANSVFLPKDAEGEYDQVALISELRKAKELYPDKVDGVITILNELPYKTLIGGMDALLAAGFPEISIASQEVR